MSKLIRQTATFKLAPVPGGTRLTFTHSGVPDKFVEDIPPHSHTFS